MSSFGTLRKLQSPAREQAGRTSPSQHLADPPRPLTVLLEVEESEVFAGVLEPVEVPALRCVRVDHPLHLRSLVVEQHVAAVKRNDLVRGHDLVPRGLYKCPRHCATAVRARREDFPYAQRDLLAVAVRLVDARLRAFAASVAQCHHGYRLTGAAGVGFCLEAIPDPVAPIYDVTDFATVSNCARAVQREARIPQRPSPIRDRYPVSVVICRRLGGGPVAAEKTEHVMIRLTPDLHQALKEEAARDDRPVAQIVRRAIQQYLKKPPRLATR